MRASVARATVILGLLIWSMPSLSQVTPSTTQVTCKPIPYTVGTALQGAEIAARLGAGALDRLAKLPDLSGVAGVEVVKTAYAGMSSQAMSEVFDALGCRVKVFIKDSDTDAEKKRAAVTMAIARLNGELAYVQGANAAGFEALAALKEQYLNAVRLDTAPVLDSAITSAALASIDTNKLFLDVATKKFWGGLNFGAVGIQACGGVVRAAIADGGSALQVSLASTRDILINYLDPNVPPVVALAKLMVVAGTPAFKPTPATVSTFMDCSKDLAQATVAGAAKASSAPAAPSIAPVSK